MRKTKSIKKIQEPWISHFSYYFVKYMSAAGLSPKEVSFSKVPTTKMYRMRVISNFGDLSYADRQKIVFDILRDKFPYDEYLRFCSIGTYTPNEYSDLKHEKSI